MGNYPNFNSLREIYKIKCFGMNPKPAKTGTRFVILLIDTLVFFIFIVLFFTILSRYSVKFQSFNIRINRIVAFSVYFSYYFFFEAFFSTTLGKIMTKTIVSDSTKFTAPTVFQIFIRSLCRFIPFDLFTIFFSKSNLTWHDKISGTSVIHKR
jgi:uncharacterized RDD family membrane protein YckC